ncbi:MAG: cystathionine beta-lyase, partial [Candidatus Cloacimonadota bacterium]|nr:cystathionine beta-lyase [Candidatus Cloacimonadota bacterium]
MKYDFDNTPQRYNTNSIKWNCVLEKFGRNDLLPLWVADMDFTIAPEIKEAIRKRNEHAIYGYTM